MHPWKAAIVALVVLATSPARAQLEDYSSADDGALRPRAKTTRPTLVAPKRPDIDSDLPPPGYRVVKRSRTGLFAAGGAVAGSGLAIFALSALTSSSDPEGAGLGVMLGGAVVGTGLVLLVVAAAMPPKRELVRDASSVAFAPVLAKDTVGGAFAVSF